MHLPFSLVPILALVPLISGCVGQSQNTSVTAQVPGSPAYDPFGLAEELFAERLDREPHLGDLLSNQPARVELMVDDCLDRPALALAAPLTLQEVLQAREILLQGRGVAFDLFAFHGTLLRVGALPVDLVQEGLLRRLRT